MQDLKMWHQNMAWKCGTGKCKTETCETRCVWTTGRDLIVRTEVNTT